jgi:HrpA-like RNA helicase
MHPVDVFYLQSPVPDYVIGVVDAISKIHQSEPSGDILAFLTGQDEVDRVVDIIKGFIFIVIINIIVLFAMKKSTLYYLFFLLFLFI